MKNVRTFALDLKRQQKGFVKQSSRNRKQKNHRFQDGNGKSNHDENWLV